MNLTFEAILALPFAEAREALLTDKYTYPQEGCILKTNGKDAIKSIDLSCSVTRIRAGLEDDGFQVLHRPGWEVDIQRVAETVRSLEEQGYPASFLLMFEAAWSMANTATELVRSTVSDTLVCNMDILAWLIDPTHGQAGFSPHRDRQPDDIVSSFTQLTSSPRQGTDEPTRVGVDAGGVFSSPHYLTCWVALTDASPSNSCLYMIPKHKDPGYMDGDIDDIDPLERCLKNKEDYQSIRAFPLAPGEAVCFTHRTLHWGSQGSARESTGPRISMALAFSDPSFEPSYILSGNTDAATAGPNVGAPSAAVDYTTNNMPSVTLRLALVCGQMICYHERFSFDAKTLNFFKKCFDIDAVHFHDTYRRKVCSEFIAAVIETTTQTVTKPGDIKGTDVSPTPVLTSTSVTDAPYKQGSSHKRNHASTIDGDASQAGAEDTQRASSRRRLKINSNSNNGKVERKSASTPLSTRKSKSSGQLTATSTVSSDEEGDGDKKEFIFGSTVSDIIAIGGSGSEDEDEAAAMEAAMEAILDGDRDGSYFVGNDDYEDSCSTGGSSSGCGDHDSCSEEDEEEK